METTVKLTDTDLNETFFKSLKALFKGKNNLEITISIKVKPATPYLFEESREEYFSKLDNSIKEIETGKVISLSAKEFKAFAEKFSVK